MTKRPEEQLAEMIANLPAKTGKSLEEWREVVAAKGAAKHGEIVSFLKNEHGVSHGYANQIALNLRKPESAEGDPIEDMFAGSKAAMRPLYDSVMAKIQSFGSDVDVAPKKGYVSIRRKKQFAILQPASARLDVGINLKGVPPTDRLEASGSFNAMLSHRVRVTTPEQVDEQLLSWLKDAYDAS